MKKGIILFTMLVLFLFAATVIAEIDLKQVKSEDARLRPGENISIILGPGSPFSTRLYEGSMIEMELGGKTHQLIVDKIGDVAVVRYSPDNGQTYRQIKMKLGDTQYFNVTTGTYFIYVDYKIFHDSTDPLERNAVFQVGTPSIERYNNPIPVKVDVNNSDTGKLPINITPVEDIKKENNNDYVKYLVGIIIVLILIIIILGPKKREEIMEKVSGNIKKGKPSKKEYYKKPKKKKFDEEDVYVVKESSEE